MFFLAVYDITSNVGRADSEFQAEGVSRWASTERLRSQSHCRRNCHFVLSRSTAGPFPVPVWCWASVVAAGFSVRTHCSGLMQPPCPDCVTQGLRQDEPVCGAGPPTTSATEEHKGFVEIWVQLHWGGKMMFGKLSLQNKQPLITFLLDAFPQLNISGLFFPACPRKLA